MNVQGITDRGVVSILLYTKMVTRIEEKNSSLITVSKQPGENK